MRNKSRWIIKKLEGRKRRNEKKYDKPGKGRQVTLKERPKGVRKENRTEKGDEWRKRSSGPLKNW